MRKFVVCVTLIALIGCARTSVKKVTSDDQQGVRYYRPKPYLLIAPDPDKDKVLIKIEHLPDFSEEYAIRVRAGTGTNDTSIQLNDNGTLKQLDVNVDSKFNENVTALTEAFKALPKPAGATPTSQSLLETAGISVPAHRVPLGLYESVISYDPQCRKRLYAWRYVGFAPFTQCPMESGGIHQTDCNEQLYGLVMDANNVMVFAPLTELPKEDIKTLRSQAAAAPGGPGTAANDTHQERLLAAVNGRLSTMANTPTIMTTGFKAELDRGTNELQVVVPGVPAASRQVVEDAIKACANMVYESMPMMVTVTFL